MTGSDGRAAARALLAALKLKCEGTHDHSQRVARVSALIAGALGLSGSQTVQVSYGALLHDIGKLATREAVLKKPGAHTHIEQLHMRLHVEAGARALTELEFPAGIVAVVLEHHERWDGLGYPHGLKGPEISLGARIVAVADAYDAITSDRCYRAGKSYQAAAAAITRGSGSQFDPDVVQAFFRVREEQLMRARSIHA
ncbi:MAG TPA: HD-GYP domain-containing protein [Pyrinomonadaceae bacterium]|nr:HD-GYP domain-containing protein [Pyrinomonadaceae bacterium]